MGTATMGKVFVRATIENLGDVEMSRTWTASPEQGP